jgi:uncharacterized membrane protein YphA (DoxX/SURF4 family)
VLSIVAWVLQALLALVFLAHGILYLFPPARMREQGGLPAGFRIFIGIAEILAAIGLVLPGLVHVLTFLAPLAAAGLVIVMIGAIVYHLRRNEAAMVPVLVVILLVAAVVVFLRWQVVPLT